MNWLGFALCFSIVLARGFQRLLSPDIWAEDGKYFILEGLTHGFASLGIPMWGSYHTIQRLIAVVFIKALPLTYLPFAICLTCFVLFALIASLITGKQYRWLIPSQRARYLAAILFCLAPGLSEMLGNLCNLNWFFFFWLALLGLRDPSTHYRAIDNIIATLVIWSIGTCVLLAPLFLWRLLHQKKEGKARSGTWVLCMMAVAFLWLLTTRVPYPFVIADIFAALPTTLFRTVTDSLLLAPWLGDWATIWFSKESNFFFGLALRIAGTISFAIWVLKNRKKPHVQALNCFILGVAVWPVLCWMSRPGCFDFFCAEVPAVFWRNRYSFPLGISAVFLWSTALTSTVGIHSKNRMLLFFFVMVSIGSIYRFRVYPYGTERKWAAISPILESAYLSGCPATVSVTTYPDDSWTFIYRSKGCPLGSSAVLNP